MRHHVSCSRRADFHILGPRGRKHMNIVERSIEGFIQRAGIGLVCFSPFLYV
jgi:hypothetical protein